MRQRTNHEVTLDERHLIRKTFAGSMRSRSFDLVSIVVQPDDIAASESCNLSSRFANTTADVKNSHCLIDLNAMSKIVFMARECLEQSLANAKATQMERLRPCLFV